MSGPLYARVEGDTGTTLIEVTKVGPAFISGRMACGVNVRAQRPRVAWVRTTDLSDDERGRFGLPCQSPAGEPEDPRIAAAEYELDHPMEDPDEADHAALREFGP